MSLLRIFLKHSGWILCFCLGPIEAVAEGTNIQAFLKNMESAYAQVVDYQVNVEVKTYKKGNAFKVEKFRYAFKKPKWIRIDLVSPRPGTILFYPDQKGKVGVRPSGWARFFKFSLAPDSFLLRGSSGQPIDQTDMGRLIENISRSLTQERHGGLEIEDDGKTIRIQVLAENHFRDGVLTRYQFLIDKMNWLPVEVSESTPEGLPEREVHFRDFNVNIGLKDSFFQLE